MIARISKLVLAVSVGTLLGCASVGPPQSAQQNADSSEDQGALQARYLPTLIGDSTSLESIPAAELYRLNLVATNLVSVMLQIPELEPVTTTLQVAKPATPFGNVLLRVMEDAGFALQLVPNDEGLNYVSYGKRVSETDAGVVNDYHLSVSDFSLTREFVETQDGIYPASLVKVTGTQFVEEINVDDSIFVEQGGSDTFVSGARSPESWSPDIREIALNDFDRIPQDKQTSRLSVISGAKQRYFESQSNSTPPDLGAYDRYRRVVLVFDDSQSLFLGEANKSSVRLMVREVADKDFLMIEACNDVDGVNDVSQQRAIRVEEEFAGYSIPVDSIFIAPCAQTSYRHPTDNAPTPVVVVHYRPKPLPRF